jgi:Bifunctional DNA primase/polymerase, N-terminal
MLIPPEIVNFSPAEAYKFYRDSLGWQVYPVHPPGSKCKYPGKQPAVEAWWNYDPQDCDVDRWFQNGHPHNIGVAPKGGLAFIDLDSKADKGASVQEFLAEHSELENIPRHKTAGGAHLVMVCTDVPRWKAANGKPYQGKVCGQINERVSSEIFYCDHQNLVLPPSKHPSGISYAWDRFGDSEKWPWDGMRGLFCFAEPTFAAKRKSKKEAPWHVQFRGDLATLDLVRLLEELGIHAELQDADEARYIIPCPWETEHSTQGDPDARIWQGGDHCPGFKCHHSHCAARTIKDVLEWAEAKEPAIVDRFCSRLRVWEKGKISAEGKPQILHAIGRLESEVYKEIGEVIGPKHFWFVRNAEVNVIAEVPSGFVYSDDPEENFTVGANTIGFRELAAIQAKSDLEEHIEPGIKKFNGGPEPEFEAKSFSSDFCCGMIQSAQLKRTLPLITRLLTVPVPFRLKAGLVRPKIKYDRQFGTYLMPDAPRIWKVSLEKAKEILARLHAGFCFTNEQSRTHAIARLITPFARAMLGWTERVPLWFYSANRPRAGKDYLAAIPLKLPRFDGHGNSNEKRESRWK